MTLRILTALGAAAMATAAMAQQPVVQPAAPAAAVPLFARVPAPPQPAGAIPLYDAAPPPGANGAASGEVWSRMRGMTPMLRNVTVPTLTPVLPAPDKANGAAVVVMPGGGFTALAMESEGWAVARRLADRGIAAFVLKYRVRPTPADEGALLADLTKSMGTMMSDPETAMRPLAPPAVADALQALKMVRAGAAGWKVDPARVGLIGFSAGAQAARDVALSPDPALRPAFVGLIYGPMREVAVPADAPPLFAALAIDDPLFGRQGFGLVDGWRKARRPVELHAYEAGGHGFGTGKAGTTTTMLIPEFEAWMAARGLLGRR